MEYSIIRISINHIYIYTIISLVLVIPKKRHVLVIVFGEVKSLFFLPQKRPSLLGRTAHAPGSRTTLCGGGMAAWPMDGTAFLIRIILTTSACRISQPNHGVLEFFFARNILGENDPTQKQGERRVICRGDAYEKPDNLGKVWWNLTMPWRKNIILGQALSKFQCLFVERERKQQ